MATPAPPVSTPAGSSRTRDWARTAEPGSAFSGLGRGGRGGGAGGGGGRGRTRGGGRGRGGAPPANAGAAASTSRALPPSDKPAPIAASTSKPTTSGSIPAASQKLSVPPATSGRPKGHGRKSSRSAVPTVVVAPSTQSAEVPASSPRPSNRRRRSQQLPSKGTGPGNASGLKVNVPALDDNLLRPQNRLLVPHSAPPPSKDTPPHLAGSFDMRNNIDALVERVRAVAMDNRPTTPGSHIDWAGDDDEGLPDLDDWGVSASVGDKDEIKDEMISPIIVDGLKPLPEPVVKPPTPSGDIKEEIVAPFVMGDQQKPPPPSQAPLHPSLPAKPVPGPIIAPHSGGRGNNNRKSPVRPTPPTAVGAAIEQAVHNSGPSKPSVDGQQTAVEEKKDDDDMSDSGREGLAASIHAPASNSLSTSSNSSTPPQPHHFNPTHNRAQTVGRPYPQSAPVNFNPRYSRSGTSTPRGGYMGGHQHTRTHSSPPAGSMLSNNRARPVITGDAMATLRRLF
ncbi:proline/serine-rich protein [Mycena alexandri]|uniref:Proline/serine-rich protein n=1 Tax=Mycena alexandri TaxID=1745969 RepID=A0AAD6XGS7_9AGAR|nr:proline/serine-rich protein [Mycena alexandri]